MKLGIVTQPLHTNYGGLLQNYALQQTLIRAGHEVETIDWSEPDSLYAKLYHLKRLLMAFLVPQKYKQPRYRLSQSEKKIIQKNTEYFIQTYINRTRAMKSLADFSLQDAKEKYEGYVVGSDQCWRPCYNSFLPAMYLCFAKNKNIKRVAYAASFGSDQWEYSKKATTYCSYLAKKFNLITVREDSGITLCKENLNVKAVSVLDPTMLLTKEDYIRLIHAEKEPNAAGNLFNYILDPNTKKEEFINQVSQDLNLKVFQILPKYQAENRTKEDVKQRINDCIFPSVTAWLRAFLDSEMTIVDSFHGVVFSIIFNKPFWVLSNKERGLSRITSLLESLKLEDRLLHTNNLSKVNYTQPIDWQYVNAILEKKRSESQSLLLKALQ